MLITIKFKKKKKLAEPIRGRGGELKDGGTARCHGMVEEGQGRAERSWAGSSPGGSDGHEARAWGFGEELELVPLAGFPADLPFTSPDFLLDSASRRRAKSRPAPQAAHYSPALPCAGSSCSN